MILPEKTADISRRQHWFSQASGKRGAGGAGGTQATYDQTFLRFLIFLEK